MTAPRTRPDRSSARRRLGRHERREAILAAAATAFAREGFAATSMADISEAAGVSHLIVYRHFDSKEALYEAVLGRAIESLRRALDAPRAVGRYGITPAALLAGARSEPDAFTVLWRHATREPAFAPLVESVRRRLERATEDALAGVAEPAQQRWAARATVAYLVEAVLVWIEDGDERLDDRFVAATDAATRAGVRAWTRPGAVG
jgi:AcrR family transcriptional regulator